MENNIKGKVIVITGASSGFGAISADSFARSLEFIINQPEDMDVNEILYRSTVQVLKKQKVQIK